MKCGDAVALLTRLLSPASAETGLSLTAPEEAVFRALVEGGYVAPVVAEAVDDAEADRLRSELREAQRREAAIREGLAAAERGQRAGERADLLRQLEDVRAAQVPLRSQVLETSERASRLGGSVEVRDRRYVVTFRGKELLFNVSSRLPKVEDLTVEEFDRALAHVRDTFARRAEKAFAILSALSPRMPKVEEIHLRSAAVGLAVRAEPPEDIAVAFREAFDEARLGTLPASLRPFVAETLCLGMTSVEPKAEREDVGRFADLWEELRRTVRVDMEEGLRASLMLHPSRERWRGILDRAAAFADAVTRGPTPRMDLPAALLVVQTSGPGAPGVARYASCASTLRDRGVPDRDRGVASALLVASDDPEVPAMLQRFDVARDYLSRFDGDGMAVPAAMLAILSPHVEESLDNLRLASAEISRRRLSLGGMENLSLGVKLLLETAIVPEAPPAPARGALPSTPPPVALLGLALASPFLLLPALSSFHETALHRLAVADSGFHPVHVHYVYG